MHFVDPTKCIYFVAFCNKIYAPTLIGTLPIKVDSDSNQLFPLIPIRSNRKIWSDFMPCNNKMSCNSVDVTLASTEFELFNSSFYLLHSCSGIAFCSDVVTVGSSCCTCLVSLTPNPLTFTALCLQGSLDRLPRPSLPHRACHPGFPSRLLLMVAVVITACRPRGVSGLI